THANVWTEPQRAMMRQAAYFRGVRWAAGVLLLFVLAAAGQYYASAQRRYLAARETASANERAMLLVNAVLTAHPAAVSYAIQNLAPLRDHAIPILQQRFEDQAAEPAERLRAGIALAEFRHVSSEYLVGS